MSDHAAVAEPFLRFQELLATAKAMDRAVLPEPTAFALGTVGADGQPAVRILLLKGVDERGFVFYTNHESRKGAELLTHPRAAMCFHWQPLERQVRVEGTAAQVSRSESVAYFATRPRGSQLGAWASAQSTELATLEELTTSYAAAEQRFEGTDVPCPEHWGGYRVTPSTIEFWQGQPSRMHDRLLYRRTDSGWTVTRLAP
jgi:pyridoxamine 5'-phosphate oxidase